VDGYRDLGRGRLRDPGLRKLLPENVMQAMTPSGTGEPGVVSTACFNMLNLNDLGDITAMAPRLLRDGMAVGERACRKHHGAPGGRRNR
jgi:hypothetical protein